MTTAGHAACVLGYGKMDSAMSLWDFRLALIRFDDAHGIPRILQTRTADQEMCGGQRWPRSMKDGGDVP